jgi:acid stress-induced BolA-like protein IbaG/YrbA
MIANEIEQRIAKVVADSTTEVEGADCDFTVTVISDVFCGLLPVKRQQMVLSGFTDVLASGELHALTVKHYTLDEWNSRYVGLVQLSL